MDISQRFNELRDGGSEVDEAVRQIFREDYNANIKELQEVSGLDGAHVGRLKGQVSKVRGKGVTPESIGGELSPSAQELQEALRDIYPKATPPGWINNIIKLYERQAPTLTTRAALETFLARRGVTGYNLTNVVDRMLPLDEFTHATQPFQTYPMPGGGFMHIIQPGQPQAGQGGPIILPISGQGGGGPIFPPAPQVISRKVKRQRLDEKGKVMTDKSGSPLYEEVEEPLVMGGGVPSGVDQSVAKALEDTRKELIELRMKSIEDSQNQFLAQLNETTKQQFEALNQNVQTMTSSFEQREKTITEAFDRKVKEIEKDRETDRKILSLQQDKEVALKDKELTELRAMHSEVLKKIPTDTGYHPGEPDWLLGAKEIRRGLGEAVDKMRELAQTMYQMPKPPGTGSQERTTEMDEILKRERG